MAIIAPRLFATDTPCGYTSDDCYTPAWVFDRMGITFDLDVCAPAGGVEWIPAARHLSVVDDGLALPWTGRVWMNPPYSNTGAWMRRFLSHQQGVCLVPHSRSRWWGELWGSTAAIADGGMFTFYKPATGTYENVFMPVVFAAFGDECVEAIGRLGVVRDRV